MKKPKLPLIQAQPRRDRYVDMQKKLAAKLISTFPSEIVFIPGETKVVSIEFKNIGMSPWHNIKLGTVNPTDRDSIFTNESWVGPGRACIQETYALPGQTARFNVTLKAPTVPGMYTESFGLVEEGVSWIHGGDATVNLTIYVRPNVEIDAQNIVRKKKRLLYLSCHQELEADEVTTFRALGYDVFTVGFFTYGNCAQDPTLREIPGNNDPELQTKFDFYFKNKFAAGMPIQLNPEFLREFDVIVNSHFLDTLKLNWDSGLDGRFLVHRTIGQGDAGYERQLGVFFRRGVPFIRMCATEPLMPGFCGQTKIIRTTIDDNIFNNWNGSKEQVLTIQKWMTRGPGRMLPEYERITANFDGKRILAGRENGTLRFGRGDVPTDELQQLRRDSRVYFSIASRKAPLTYTIVEAMMTGMPVVSVGTKLAGYSWFEPPTLIENGVNGFCSDSEQECTKYIDILMKDVELGKKIGTAGRASMQKLFSPHIIQNDWKEFFKSFGISNE